MPDTTSELFHRLKSWESGRKLLNQEETVSTCSQVLLELLEKAGLSAPEWMTAADVSKSYGYQILRGERVPGRDILLRTALALGLSLKETQRLLAVGGCGALYPRVRRDAAVIFALNQKMSLLQAEELLSSLSDRWPHRDALQAGLLRRTGRGEEAAELWERRLLNAATEVYESLVSLQELALQAERLEDGARLAALIEETVERYALIPGVASSGRLQQAAAEGDKTAALSALRDMLEALNRSWDGGGLYPHLLPGTQVAVGSVLLPGLLLELQREPELAFLQDEPEFQALLKRYGGGTH